MSYTNTVVSMVRALSIYGGVNSNTRTRGPGAIKENWRFHHVVPARCAVRRIGSCAACARFQAYLGSPTSVNDESYRAIEKNLENSSLYKIKKDYSYLGCLNGTEKVFDGHSAAVRMEAKAGPT